MIIAAILFTALTVSTPSEAAERSESSPLISNECGSSVDQNLSESNYREALRLQADGSLARAQDKLSTAIEYAPCNMLAYLARAGVRIERGDIVGALGDVEYVITMKPTLAEAYYVRGQIHMRLHLWASAARDLKLATQLEPDLADAQFFLQLALSSMAQFDFWDAIGSLTRAIAKDDDASTAYFLRSFAYERVGQLTAAISDMNAAIGLSRSAEAFHRRAELFIRTGLDGQALSDLNASITLNPQDAEALADRARLHKRIGDSESAAVDLRKRRAILNQSVQSRLKDN